MNTIGSNVVEIVREVSGHEKVWIRHTTGQKIPIKDMNDEHLKAAIVMVTRGYDINGRPIAGFYDGLLNDIREELKKRNLEVKEAGWDA